MFLSFGVFKYRTNECLRPKLPPGKSLRQRYTIPDCRHSINLRWGMFQQDVIRVIFEFTATQSFHCRYNNINNINYKAKFKNSKWQEQKVMWPKWWNNLVTWFNENWILNYQTSHCVLTDFLWRCWQFSDFCNNLTVDNTKTR